MAEKEQKVYSQKCVTCGGDLVFNPKKQVVQCVQCGNVVPIKTTMTTEKSFETLLKNAPQWQTDTIVLRCEHCGAKAVINKNDLAKRCDYCGATSIVKSEDLPGIRPDTIVLFNLTKVEAVAKARTWLAKRFFAPRWYKKSARAQNMHAIYYPSFTFDAQTFSRYRGLQMETYTKTDYVDGKPVVRTYTTTHPVSGELSKVFDDVLIPASDTLNAAALAKLQPFATNEGVAYQKELLSGYTASHYTQDALQCWNTAKNQMDNRIKQEIVRRHGGNVIDLAIDTKISNVTYKYALLPLYVGHSEYDDCKYELYVNGQTGKTYGKTPVSPWKVLLVTALGLAAVAGAFLLAMIL